MGYKINPYKFSNKSIRFWDIVKKRNRLELFNDKLSPLSSKLSRIQKNLLNKNSFLLYKLQKIMKVFIDISNCYLQICIKPILRPTTNKINDDRKIVLHYK